MRPTRLEVSGFTSFRNPTVIEFEDCDYFAFVGPTGSGKSSIIDAICFALYGSVPRYDDKRLVAPVVSQGQIEAKVRLDFTVGDDRYTAARVVKLTAKGASVKEARLEKEGEAEPLAGTGPELTAAVTELLGLTFEHFTKCVVLPQGDFARFLHDDPKDRQEFLVKLLNLGIYNRMQQIANARAGLAKDKIAYLQERIEELGDRATETALKEARAHVKRLETLRKDAADAQPAIDAFDKQIADARSKVEENQRWLDLIEELSIPDEVEALNDRMAAAEKLLQEAEEAVSASRKKMTAAIAAQEALPPRKPLDAALTAHDRKGELEAEIATATERTEEATAAEASARASVDEAEAALEEVETALDDLRVAHAAEHLAEHLAVGEPCPVCLRPVEELPHHAGAPGLKEAERASREAKKQVELARTEMAQATTAVAASKSVLKTLLEQYERVESELAEHPDRAAIEKVLSEIDEAESALTDLRKQEGAALDRAEEARASVRALKDEAQDATADLDAARDSLAVLKPPAPKRKDLVEDWEALLGWTAQQVSPLKEQIAASSREITAAEKERERAVAKIEKSCQDCEIEIGDRSVLEAVVAALADAKREAKDIEKSIETVAEAHEQLKALRLDQETSHQLGQHLAARAGGFVSWMVNEAVRRLVDGATLILKELSNDQYALTIDDRGDFFVIDLGNAGEMRSARTLSGGETFLTSLSLALALADQLSDLAAGATARLDAIFLDEGFGTLDPETLATVAQAVENLSVGGRMVGIVTHVRELADRVPVQFRVTKDHNGSRVEKVSA